METSNVQPNIALPDKEIPGSPHVPKNFKKTPDLTDVNRVVVGEFSSENTSDQLVLYNAENGDRTQEEAEVGENHSPSRLNATPVRRNRGLPSIGAFAVQCAKCFKWRLMPSKEMYEKIREQILQDPFTCELAREWRDLTCDDPEDISQDGSRLWAIDKPNIARPPCGWERIIRIRAEGGTRFADVHYTSPSGRKLRSMVEIEKYLAENPDYAAKGVSLSQFSFQIPRPLQDNYVKRRPPLPRVNSSDGGSPGLPKPLDAEEAPSSGNQAGEQAANSPSLEQRDSAKVGAPATPAKRKAGSLDS